MYENGVNVFDLCAQAHSDEEADEVHGSYYDQPVWVEQHNADGTYDLYIATGFQAGACQPTLRLEHVQHVGRQG